MASGEPCLAPKYTVATHKKVIWKSMCMMDFAQVFKIGSSNV